MVRWLAVLAFATPLAAAEPRLDADGVPFPEGCLARVGSTRFRIWRGLEGPTVTVTGELLFTEREGDVVQFRFMDATTGLFVRKVTLPRAAADGAGRTLRSPLDRDGRLLPADGASAGRHADTADLVDGEVVVRDAATGHRANAPADPSVHSLRFLDGGTTLAAYSLRAASHWAVATARPLNRYDRPTEWEAVPFADGRKVFADLPGKGIDLLDVLTGRPEPGYWSFLSKVPKWRPSDDGRVVVTASSEGGWTRLASHGVAPGVAESAIRWLPIRYPEGLALSRDGERVAVVGESLSSFPPAPRIPGRRRPPPPSFVQVVTCDLSTGDLRGLGTLWNQYSSPRLRLTPDGGRLLVACERRPADVKLADGQSPPDPTALFDVTTGRRIADLDAGEGRPELAATADSRAFAIGGADGTVRVIEAATGGVRVTFRHKDAITALEFSPDGSILAAASDDAPVYLWDVRGTRLGLPKSFDAEAGEKLWAALADPSAAKAFDAARRLAAAPDAAVKLLARSLPPATAPAPAWVDARLTELRDPAFAVRERAAADLGAVVETIRPRLDAERARNGSAEVQWRLARVLTGAVSNSPARLRAGRAVEVMEWVGTPAAVEVLTAWAGGADRAPLTVAAGQALRRTRR